MKNNEEYRKLVKQYSTPTPVLKNTFFAFLFGGGICLLGELIRRLFLAADIGDETAGLLTTAALILLSVVISGFGIYDRLAKIGGAGMLVPVTGFANAVVSPAIDTKSEGPVLGIGAKIFSVAGPVILFAVLSGTVFGVIYYFATLA